MQHEYQTSSQRGGRHRETGSAVSVSRLTRSGKYQKAKKESPPICDGARLRISAGSRVAQRPGFWIPAIEWARSPPSSSGKPRFGRRGRRLSSRPDLWARGRQA